MAKRQYIDGTCQICGAECKAFISYSKNNPFIDGKSYEMVCHCCMDVPKMWEIKTNYDDGFAIHEEYILIYDEWNMNKLHTINSLMEEGGWDKVEATRSIRAVKKAIDAAKRLKKKKTNE